MWPDFSQRSSQLELMDDPTIPAAELVATLGELDWLNNTFRGHQISLLGIRSLIPNGAKTLSVLDVGTGSGDLVRALVHWAAQDGMLVQATGIDLLPAAIEHARASTPASAPVAFARQDLFDYPDQPLFDVVHAGLVLHHCPGQEAVAALQKMYALSRWGVVINDLHRHPLHWLGVRAIVRLMGANRLVRADGPLSVLRAFSRGELETLAADAQLEQAEISWHPPFRWLLVCRKPAN